LDDFKVILGNNFLKKAKISMMPHHGRILISDEKFPCFVKAIPFDKQQETLHETSLLLAMQVKKGAKREEPTFVTVLVETKPEQTVNVPDTVAKVLWHPQCDSRRRLVVRFVCA